MDPTDHEDIIWLHTQLTGHVNDLSHIYEHVAFAIQRLQDEKQELQSKVDQLEQDNPSAEVRRLRDENSILRARLASASKAKAEVTRERDALFRKLYSIRLLIDGPALDEGDTSTDAQNTRPGPRSAASTVRPRHAQHSPAVAHAQQHPIPTAELTSPTHTVLSEPKTDATVVHDTFGRVIKPHSPEHPQAAAAATTTATATNGHSQTAQPLPTHTSATDIDDTRARDQDVVASPQALDAPFVDTREPSSSSPPPPLSPPVFRPLHLDLTDSPLHGSSGGTRILSLNSSPGMSDGLSVQYDDSPRPLAGTGTASKVTVQKWRVHFAKPPSSATAVALPKPVTTATLLQNLELDEDARRSIEGLSSEPAGNLRLYIYDVLGLAFLYDPVLLEAPEATYVVEWCDVKAGQNSRAYITTAKEKHAELHTFMYAPRKNGWHYLGQQRWSLADIKSIWGTLSQPAQRVLATRALQNAEPGEITRRLKRGQIEQLTIELQQVSLVQPSPGEAVLAKKLRE